MGHARQSGPLSLSTTLANSHVESSKVSSSSSMSELVEDGRCSEEALAISLMREL